MLANSIQRSRLVLVLVLSLILTGCASLIAKKTQAFAKQIENTIVESNDPETIKDAIPAYLVLLESMSSGSPENTGYLLATSKLYAAYASINTNNPYRQKTLTQTAYNYAAKALCLENDHACKLKSMSINRFKQVIKAIPVEHIDALYAVGTTWAGWLQVRSDDWDAIAELPRVQFIMEHIVKLNPDYDKGQAQLYMGVLNSLLPKSLGGKLDLAQKYYMKAVRLSKGHNLMAKVLYAKQYARMVFDKDLHDKLLNQVLKAKTNYPGYGLSNTIAKREARKLLKSSDDYF